MGLKIVNAGNAPSHIARSRKWEEDVINKKPNLEVAALYDRKGGLVASRIGEAHNVGFGNAELTAARGGTLTHYHHSGHSFSHEDLAMAHSNGLTVRAFGTDKEGNCHYYQAKAMVPSQAQAEAIVRNFPHQEKQAKNDLINSKDSKGLSDEEITRKAREATVTRVARENGLNYTHTVKPGRGVAEAIEGYRKGLTEPVVEYSPDQARDAQGRFTTGDSGFAPLVKDEAHQTAVKVHADAAKGQGKVNGFAQKGVDRYEAQGRRLNSMLRTYDLSHQNLATLSKFEQDSNIPLSHEDIHSISVMDHLTTESTIPHDMAIYRGVENSVADNFKNMKVGDTFKENGFLTGQVSSKDANGYRGAKGEGGFVKIEIDKGSNGFVDATHGTSVTLPRGSRFMLMGKSSAAVPSSPSGPARMVPVYHVRLMK